MKIIQLNVGAIFSVMRQTHPYNLTILKRRTGDLIEGDLDD